MLAATCTQRTYGQTSLLDSLLGCVLVWSGVITSLREANLIRLHTACLRLVRLHSDRLNISSLELGPFELGLLELVPSWVSFGTVSSVEDNNTVRPSRFSPDAIAFGMVGGRTQ